MSEKPENRHQRRARERREEKNRAYAPPVVLQLTARTWLKARARARDLGMSLKDYVTMAVEKELKAAEEA